MGRLSLIYLNVYIRYRHPRPSFSLRFKTGRWLDRFSGATSSDIWRVMILYPFSILSIVIAKSILHFSPPPRHAIAFPLALLTDTKKQPCCMYLQTIFLCKMKILGLPLHQPAITAGTLARTPEIGTHRNSRSCACYKYKGASITIPLARRHHSFVSLGSFFTKN